MKKIHSLFAIVTLLLASLACQTVTGGGDADYQPEIPAESPSDSDDGGEDFSFGSDADFPMPDDASNVINAAGTLNYQTELPLDDVLKFYRDYYLSNGYTEREILTTVSDEVFSIVFDGDASGKAIVIQAVDLTNGTTNVNISLQDV